MREANENITILNYVAIDKDMDFVIELDDCVLTGKTLWDRICKLLNDINDLANDDENFVSSIIDLVIESLNHIRDDHVKKE